jgi:cellulase
MSFASKLITISTFAAAALAHGTVSGVVADKTFYQGFKLDYYYAEQQGQTAPDHYGWYAENLDNGFVAPDTFGKADIICHKNAKVGGAKTAKVAAGGAVDFQWTTWPESHVGPVLTYVADCGTSCDDVDKSTLKFVKIDAVGYNADTKTWAATDMIKNNNTWTTTVPSSLKAGNYVFRHEIIALHSAGQENGAQSYPQCVNIEVTGSGTELPEGTLGTALYKSTDKGIMFDVYGATINYEMPGPKLFGSSGSGTKPAPSEAPVASSKPTPTAAPSKPSTPAEAPTATATATPAATEAPANPQPSQGGDSSLPQTFTLDTFIAWLQEKAGSNKARRHARSFDA